MKTNIFNYEKYLSRPQSGFRYCFIDRMNNKKLSFSQTNLKNFLRISWLGINFKMNNFQNNSQNIHIMINTREEKQKYPCTHF